MLIDGGDILGNNLAGDHDRAELMFKAMHDMGYRIATPGEKDLSYGFEFVSGLAKKNGIRLVSANVYDGVTQKLLLPEYHVYSVAEQRIGIFGVLSPTLTITPVDGEAMPETRDAIEAARAVVPKLRDVEHCDVVVALLHMPNSQSAELLKLVPGIDLAVYGHDSGIRSELETVESTQVVRTGDRGQRIALVDVMAGAPGEKPSFTGEFILLAEGVPENVAMGAALTTADEEIRARVGLENARMVAERELGRGDDHYLGDITCVRCHEIQTTHWGTTAHAHAFARLEETHQEKDTNCVSCHVTGYGRPSGFVDAHSAPDLRNVQCEACHGVGTAHGPGYAAAAKSSCTTCHTGEFERNFDYDTAWKKIQHPKAPVSLSSAGSKG